jgi:S1-C subfamily serine protease
MALIFSSGSAVAQESLIERVEKSQDSIVGVQAGRVENGTPIEQSGAGIIIDPSGYIATNTHTILYAQFVLVTLSNGTRLPATIAAITPDSDVTFLKTDPPSPLKAIHWADSDAVRLGDAIITVGNSPLLKNTISGGTVKGIGQSQSGSGHLVDLIETDLNLYNGDSGGPILDRQGNFLGIITAKNLRVERSSWAIPSNKIREAFLSYLNGARK